MQCMQYIAVRERNWKDSGFTQLVYKGFRSLPPSDVGEVNAPGPWGFDLGSRIAVSGTGS